MVSSGSDNRIFLMPQDPFGHENLRLSGQLTRAWGDFSVFDASRRLVGGGLPRKL
jgi:hypothetical protein